MKKLTIKNPHQVNEIAEGIEIICNEFEVSHTNLENESLYDFRYPTMEELSQKYLGTVNDFEDYQEFVIKLEELRQDVCHVLGIYRYYINNYDSDIYTDDKSYTVDFDNNGGLELVNDSASYLPCFSSKECAIHFVTELEPLAKSCLNLFK